MGLARRKGGRKAHPARPERGEKSAAASSRVLLAWYARHRRVLPWRAPPGEAADPYRVWLSEVMLQQTTVKAVGPYYGRFLARWPDVAALAAAPLEDVLKAWAGLGYYARARNLHACARAVVERHGGRFPSSEQALRALPGIGAYTAAAVAAIAYDAPATPVDGNIERVVARLFAVDEPLPAAKPRLQALAKSLTPRQRPGDFAQALMDLGATICTPKRPACALCPLMQMCAARALGGPEEFPVKAARAKGELRRGAAFVVRRADDTVLVRRRPEKGLLGGMTEVPTTEWSVGFDVREGLAQAPALGRPTSPRGLPPPPVEWRRLPGVVTHTFTHFPLELVVYAALVPEGTKPRHGMWFVPLDALAAEALPSLMRKVVAHAFESHATGHLPPRRVMPGPRP
jgi:A/G-specific adenine glycosylase